MYKYKIIVIDPNSRKECNFAARLLDLVAIMFRKRFQRHIVPPENVEMLCILLYSMQKHTSDNLFWGSTFC